MKKFNSITILTLNSLGYICRLIPKFLYEFLWSLSSAFDGYFALSLRYILLKGAAKNVGQNVYIGKYVTIKNLKNFTIGNNVSIHNGCYIDAAGGIDIGSNVSIAHQSSLISFEHGWANSDLPIKYNETLMRKIKIADDVWVGCGVRVLSGAQVEKRVIIAAGAVVRGVLKSGHLWAGVPAKNIKRI